MNKHRQNMMAHEHWMRFALKEAIIAGEKGEIPVGAVIVRGDKIIAAAHNECEGSQDPTAHAELLAIRSASQRLFAKLLPECLLYVTLEPCPMCAGAISMARLSSVVFGARDEKTGCCGSIYRLTEDTALALKKVPAYGGVLGKECADLLQAFFSGKRKEGCK